MKSVNSETRKEQLREASRRYRNKKKEGAKKAISVFLDESTINTLHDLQRNNQSCGNELSLGELITLMVQQQAGATVKKKQALTDSVTALDLDPVSLKYLIELGISKSKANGRAVNLAQTIKTLIKEYEKAKVKISTLEEENLQYEAANCERIDDFMDAWWQLHLYHPKHIPDPSFIDFLMRQTPGF